MEINIIAAVADNGAIGRQNSLPWHISEDMKYFRKLTAGGTLIMGRKTFESIGRPLPGRRNIVISGTMPQREGLEVVRSLGEALSLARTKVDGQEQGSVFIIGGGEIYRQAMEFADRLYVTRVHTAPEDADTFFPDISPEVWEETEKTPMKTDPESGLLFEFVTCRRRAGT